MNEKSIFSANLELTPSWNFRPNVRFINRNKKTTKDIYQLKSDRVHG